MRTSVRPPADRLAHVDRGDAPGGQRPHGSLQVEGYPQVLREVIERAERQHAERRGGPDQGRGHRADGAVAAAGRHDLRALLASDGQSARGPWWTAEARSR